jgi:hypothetical protein
VTLSPSCLTASETWRLYECAVVDLEKKDLTHEAQLKSIEEQQKKIDAFETHFDLHWGQTCLITGFYKHWLKCHCVKQRRYLYIRFGISMWMLSTSISEHGNKMAKAGVRHLQGFNRGLKNKFWMYMRDCVLRILKFPR